MHNLSDKYKFCKRLINAMSSFGAKAVLRQDIVTKDAWIQNSSEICEYIVTFECVTSILTQTINKKRFQNKRM